jgi:hypothetical protein
MSLFADIASLPLSFSTPIWRIHHLASRLHSQSAPLSLVSFVYPYTSILDGDHADCQTRDNVRFAMSQELAQDEGEADAEDYEIDNLEGRSRRLSDEEEGGGGDGYSTIESDARSLKTLGSMKGRGGGGEVREENVVFAMGDDSDSDEDGDHEGKGYKDVERRMRDDSPRRRASGDESDGEGEGLVKGSGSKEV